MTAPSPHPRPTLVGDAAGGAQKGLNGRTTGDRAAGEQPAKDRAERTRTATGQSAGEQPARAQTPMARKPKTQGVTAQGLSVQGPKDQESKGQGPKDQEPQAQGAEMQGLTAQGPKGRGPAAPEPKGQKPGRQVAKRQEVKGQEVKGRGPKGRGADARRDEIVRLATETGLASVEELAARLGVTQSTIRRDLAHLKAAGLLARTYGGAMAVVTHPEASLRQRIGEAFEAKRAIASWAAAQVRPGETILLDSGSTTGALAHELRNAADLTVATTGLTALQELVGATGVHVECLGGTLRHVSQGFVGPLAEAALSRMTFDRAFLGADGVTAEDGICEASLQQTRLKELMMARSQHVYVLVHAAKLGRRPFHAWARMPDRWTLVTDASATDDLLEPFAARGVETVIAI